MGRIPAGRLGVRPSQDGGVLMLINWISVEKLARVVPGAMELVAAAAALGISKARVRHPVDCGVLVPARRADTADRLSTEGFARAYIEALLQRVSVVSDDGAAGMPVLSFERAAETLRCRSVDPAGTVAIVGCRWRSWMIRQSGLDACGSHRSTWKTCAASWMETVS